MRYLATALVGAVLVAGSAGQTADACDYSINLFNHRLEGEKLRLYLEMRTALGLPILGELDAAKFDTVHNPGDAIITEVGTYHSKGNGLSSLLMLDRSGSMRRMQAQERDAAIRYIDSMDSKDEVSLYFFAEDAHPYPFSDDPGVLRSIIHKEMRGKHPAPMPGGATPLYKHLIEGVKKVSTQAKRELAFLLIMTDGQEEVGGYTADDVIKTAREKRVPIFAVGFYHQWSEHGRTKDNSKELQILEKIATQTGGQYILADVASNLSEIFVAARIRARNFIVIDATLCGVSRQQAAQSPRVDVQVAYEDCKSNVYSVPLPPIEKDFPPCPQCRSDADCQTNERCVANACEMVPCGKCQNALNHRCQDVACSSNDQCASECECRDGKCVEKPPCNEWQVFDPERKECVGKPCSSSDACPDPAECCKGRCEKRRECSPWMKKDPQTCACLDIPCHHDGQCPDGILCDGEYCADPEGKQVTKAECKDGKLSLNGKCQKIKCTQDSDCFDEKTQQKWVCAPRIGLSRDDATDRICQLLRAPPCEEWEEEIEGNCRVVACEKDEDCPEAGVCDEKSGECVAGGLCARKNLPICIAIGGFGALAIIFLGIALRKKRKEEEALSESVPSTPPPEPSAAGPIGMTEIAHEPSPPVAGKGGTEVAPGLADSRRTMPDARRAAAFSPYSLEIDIQGQVTRRPLPFGISTLGRETGDIIVPHQIVSGSHLTLNVGEQGISIMDLDSTNGTFVDGRRLPPNVPTSLLPGQQVMLGGTVRLTVLSAQGGGGPAASQRKQATRIVD